MPEQTKEPAKLTVKFTAKCPLCPFTATAVRNGVEMETLAAHLVYTHVPDTATA